MVFIVASRGTNWRINPILFFDVSDQVVGLVSMWKILVKFILMYFPSNDETDLYYYIDCDVEKKSYIFYVTSKRISATTYIDT